jgi:dTDP-4-amino-4,6-dideoxygalactose transaminase
MTFGAEAFKGAEGELPNPFPRIIGPNAMKYLREVVESGLSCDMVDRFERAFAEAHGVRHCMATPGCTPALAVLAAGIGFDPGDEIIVSPVTDYGTVQGLIAQNYIPVFADTAPGTVNMSAQTIKAVITDRTRGVLVVHKTGIICDMDPIGELAAQRGLVVYEDVCQAVLGRYKGKLAGTLGLAAAFSFDSEKTMGSDVGVCILTDDDELAERLRFVGHRRAGQMEAGFGRKHTELGYAYRMTLSTAAISLAQLEIIEEEVAQVDRMVRLLSEKIAEIPGVVPLPIPDYLDVYSCWMFGMNIDRDAFRCDADDFAGQLVEAGIPGAGTGRYYLMPAALPFLSEKALKKEYPYSQPPASREYSYTADSCPRAADFLESFIRWSTFCSKYREEQVELAARIVREVAEKNRA